MTLLEATGIGKVYPGGVVANDGVNLTITGGGVDTGGVEKSARVTTMSGRRSV